MKTLDWQEIGPPRQAICPHKLVVSKNCNLRSMITSWESDIEPKHSQVDAGYLCLMVQVFQAKPAKPC